ncbi:MAG: PD40 domain-containing protein [Flavobacteriales bacterium]|nr:PD40 domain-containing protein [Flavobacteriales bacterium]
MKKFILPILFSTLFVFGFHFNANAQKLHYELPDNASKLFVAGNYTKALELYREIYKKDMTDTKNGYHFGVCLVNTFDFENGIKTLEKVSKKSDAPQEVWFYLAKGYHATLRFDKAIETYKKFLQTQPSNASLADETKRRIEQCNNAKELIKNPVNVTFENLGNTVNSKGKDYLPLIADMESYLLFTTRREGTTGRIFDLEGNYTADIYASKFKSTAWSKAASIGSPNSYGNEQTAGISENGEIVFYYVNNPESKNNLQIAEKSKSTFKKPEMVKGKHINNKTSEQISATITNEKDLVIYSSNVAGGKGGFDLYISRMLPNGTWSAPENIGDAINTPYNENYPYLTNNGNTLYFASEGHHNIGGYDVFKSEYNNETNTWSKPENIGYPLNTPLDDYSICFTQDKKFAYLAAFRKDSYGDYDIYKVTLNNEPPSLTTIKGYVINQDSVVINEPIRMEVFNVETGDLQGIYESNKKGTYIMILPPGKYNLIAETPNNQPFTKKFEVKGRKFYKPELNQNIRINFAEPQPVNENKQ